jgi:hypothetical protein
MALTKKQEQEGYAESLDSKKSLFDYIGRDTEEDYKPRSHPIKSKFCDKIKEIQVCGHEHGLFDGEILQMIFTNYKWKWSTIPWGRMDEVKQFIAANAFRSLAILSPKMHRKIMNSRSSESIDLQKWSQEYADSFEHNVNTATNYYEKW